MLNAQPAAPPIESPPAPVAPQSNPATSPNAGGETTPDVSQPPASPAYGKPLPWDDDIERIVTQRYPRSVDELRRIQRQVNLVVEHARPAVVAVEIGGSLGSGVIVNAEGLVLTAGHVVVRPGLPVTFRFPDGSKARGRTLGVNYAIDSGMMKITDKPPSDAGWPHLPVAEPGALRLGEWVVCLGQPNGYYLDRAPPVRLGRVLFQDESIVNTDCTLVGGDSGGPLLNLRGEVVGIHSRIGEKITNNIHVPVSTYAKTWDRLLAGESWGGGRQTASRRRARARPFLGVMLHPDAPPCRVTQLEPGMPAEKAGILVGDAILRFDNQRVENRWQLARLVLLKKPNDEVTLLVDRDGEQLEIVVRLGVGGRNHPGAPPLDSPKKIKP